ncbi:PIN domain-containing protein [Candidatus Pacearchaeota archaeon]|nr:PIN domain-containing protein [Candidatus Pacearchaeota archaeon]MBD3283318.1 PIN domain-containing protein [Candidatus Pacearchaeota archaeon]
MKDKIKIGAVEKVIHTNRMIRRVGLDSDVMIALVDDSKQFSMFKPKIFSRKNLLFINYKVFSELLGHFMYNRKLSKENSLKKIFAYLRKNKITLLKKKDTDINKVQEIFESLKKQKQILDNNAGDKDLMIISIYKVHNINLIFSRNKDDFKPFCEYLGISFEKLQEDLDTMWGQVFGWRRRR